MPPAPRPPVKFWTAAERKTLEHLLRSCTATREVYAAMPARPRSGIAHQAAAHFPELWQRFNRPSLYEDGRLHWRPWEVSKLGRILRTCPSTEVLYERFAARSPSGIAHKAKEQFPALWNRFRRKQPLQAFTPAEDAIILKHYGHPDTSASKIARMLGRDSRREVIARFRRLRLKGQVPAEALARLAQVAERARQPLRIRKLAGRLDSGSPLR